MGTLAIDKAQDKVKRKEKMALSLQRASEKDKYYKWGLKTSLNFHSQLEKPEQSFLSISGATMYKA